MATKLCGAVGGNVGIIDCDASRGITKHIAISGGSFSAQDYASPEALSAAISAKAKLSRSAAQKLFPLPQVQEIADNSEANKEGSLGLGFKDVLVEGKPAFSYKVFANSSLSKALRKWNKQIVKVFIIDENNKIWGRMDGTNFVGIEAKVFVSGLKEATGGNVEEGVVSVMLMYVDEKQYYDEAAYAELASPFSSSAKGLLDVQLVEAVSSNTNARKIGGVIKTSKAGVTLNVYEDFSAAMVADKWKATNLTTGADFAITSVAPDTTNKCWTVTLDSTAYTSLAVGSKIKIEWVDPTALDAASIPGIESVPVIITKAA